MHGHIWRTRDLVIEVIDIAAGRRLVNHAHEAPQLALLERGRIEGRFGGRNRIVEAGTSRLSPAGDTIDLSFTEASRCIIVNFPERLCGVDLPAIEDRRFDRSGRISALASELRSTLRTENPSPLALECLVLELRVEASSDSKDRTLPPPPWLLRVRERIRDEPASPPSTAELAEEAGYHPIYVARLFRQCFGIGLGEYSRVARAEYARSLLERSELALAEVAQEAGYTDQSHLSRSMRRFLNETPRTLRLGRARPVQVSSVQDSPFFTP